MRGFWHSKGKAGRLSLLTVALIATTVGLAVAADVKVEPLCPVTITRGGQLTIDLRLTNQTPAPVTIGRSGLIVHLGALNVQGPFVIPLTHTFRPFESITQSGYLNVTFPANASLGTFASVGVGVFSQTNKVLGRGLCLIEVQ